MFINIIIIIIKFIQLYINHFNKKFTELKPKLKLL